MSEKISFQCKHCGKKLSVNAAYAGRSGKCKGCDTTVIVPEASEGSEFEGLVNELGSHALPVGSPNADLISKNDPARKAHAVDEAKKVQLKVPDDFEHFHLDEKLEFLRKAYAREEFIHWHEKRIRSLTNENDRHLPNAFIGKKIQEFLTLSLYQIQREPGVGDTKIHRLFGVMLRGLQRTDESAQAFRNSVSGEVCTNQLSLAAIEPLRLGEIADSLNNVSAALWDFGVSELFQMTTSELQELPGIGASKAEEISAQLESIKGYLRKPSSSSAYSLVLARREIVAVENWCFEVVGEQQTLGVLPFRLNFVLPVLKLIECDFDLEMRQIVVARIGLNEPPQTLKEISEQFGVTRERIRQKLVKVADALNMRFPRGDVLLSMVASLPPVIAERHVLKQLIRECESVFFSTEKSSDQTVERPSAKEVLGAWTKLGREHSTPFSHAELVQWISDQFPGVVDNFAFELIASDALVVQCPNGKTIFLTNRVEDRAYAFMLNATGRVTLVDLSEELEVNERSLKVALASDQRIAMDDDQNLVLLEDIGFKRHDGKWFLNLHPIQDSPDLDNEVIIPVETIVNCVLNGISGKGIVDASVWGVYRFVNDLLEYEYRSTFPLGVDEIVLADVLVAHSNDKITNMRRRRLRWDDPESPTAIGKKGWIAKVVSNADFAITVDELDEGLREFYQDYASYVLDQLESSDDEDGDETASFEVLKIARSGLPVIVSPSNSKFTVGKEPVSLLVESALAGLTDQERAQVIEFDNCWINASLQSESNSKQSSEAYPTLKDSDRIPDSYVDLVEGVVAILADNGEPMHIGKIREELVQMGVQIPGRGKDANIIVYLRKSTDFCRTATGTYALTSWGLPTIDKPQVGWKRDKKKPVHSNGELRSSGAQKALDETAQVDRPMQIYEAAFQVLSELGKPTHVRKIREQIESKGYFRFGAQDPEGALAVAIDRHANNVEISRQVEPTLFYRHSPATYGLLEWKSESTELGKEADPQSIVASMEAETWFALSHWAKVNDELQPKERSLAYSVGKVLNNGNMPSPKQAKWAVDILCRAKADGFDANNVERKNAVADKPPKSNLRTDTVNDVLASFILGE